MKRYIRSDDDPNGKSTTLGLYIENYLKDNYGYQIYENWSYHDRAYKSRRPIAKIAKLFYLGIPYVDIQAAVDDAISANPYVADKVQKYPYVYNIHVIDMGEVSVATSDELVQGVVVHMNNAIIYV